MLSIHSAVKYLILFLLLIVTPIRSYATNELDKTLSSYYTKNGVKIENKSVDDYTIIRRIYLDLAGRIPAPEEIKSFVQDRRPDKKQKIVEKLLTSEDYVNNFYNFFADLLRIRPERLADNIQMKSYPYIQYVRANLRTDKGWDIWVREMLTAQGKPAENGATGYILRDDGMAFDNISLSTKIFMADDYSCSNCHNDTFSDKTMKQFYELASFFNNDNRMSRKDYGNTLKRIDSEIQAINGNTRVDNNVRQLLGVNLINITDNANKTIKYPFDYKYDNAKPGEIAKAVTPDQKIIGDENKRTVIANWMISQDNFSYAIVNRLWLNLIGNNLFYPQLLTDFNIENSSNKELIRFLGNYFKTHNYSIRDFIKLVVLSDFYNRPSYSGMDENYKFQGMFVKRLTAHQIWDSILTLILKDPNYTKIALEEYSKLVTVNWETLNGKDLLAQIEQIRNWERNLDTKFLKHNNIELVRSCYNFKNNGFVNLFLKEFGVSERVLLDTTSNSGSITQILTLMNSPIMALVTDKKSQIMGYSDKNDLCLAILARPIAIVEKPFVDKLNIADTIWVLLNTRDFLFRR